MTVRKRDADRTRDAILRAAQQAFSQHGYAATGVREITAHAGVNPALVSRYFGSKEKLFEAALAGLLDTAAITSQPRLGFGKAVVASFLDGPGDRLNPLPMLMLATADPTARLVADRLLRERAIAPLADWFGSDAAAPARAARFVLLASGFFTYRLLYPLDTWTGALDPESRVWLETAFQTLVDD